MGLRLRVQLGRSCAEQNQITLKSAYGKEKNQQIEYFFAKYRN
jgi:hypothetical protein